MRKFWVELACGLVLSVSFFGLYSFGYLSTANSATLTEVAPQPSIVEQQVEEAAQQIKEPTLVFGIPSDSFLVIHQTIKSGQSLSQILQKHNISTAQLNELRQKAKNVFNLQQIRANRPYTLLVDNDSAQTARYFIYQPSVSEYVVVNLQDSLHIYTEEKQLQMVEKTLTGTIESSLYVAMAEAGCSAGLINHFADIYSWKINFGAVQPGDKFKLIYEEQQLEGKPVGYGRVKAALFEHNGKELYAIYHGEGKSAGYYDEYGKSLQKAFLKEPLEYSRISSRFSLKRFHPVQKRFKAHLGTDFAAPRGTPIRSVGQGVVVEAGYNRGNGNYVKIEHDHTYTTQYLHMSKFAKGIKKGARIAMGQTIGFVGSTGLATGPHLCYRFWKNGKQVDPLREKLPQATGIDPQEREEFAQLSQEMLTKLQQMEGEKSIIAVGENTPENNPDADTDM